MKMIYLSLLSATVMLSGFKPAAAAEEFKNRFNTYVTQGTRYDKETVQLYETALKEQIPNMLADLDKISAMSGEQYEVGITITPPQQNDHMKRYKIAISAYDKNKKLITSYSGSGPHKQNIADIIKDIRHGLGVINGSLTHIAEKKADEALRNLSSFNKRVNSDPQTLYPPNCSEVSPLRDI